MAQQLGIVASGVAHIIQGRVFVGTAVVENWHTKRARYLIYYTIVLLLLLLLGVLLLTGRLARAAGVGRAHRRGRHLQRLGRHEARGRRPREGGADAAQRRGGGEIKGVSCRVWFFVKMVAIGGVLRIDRRVFVVLPVADCTTKAGIGAGG